MRCINKAGRMFKNNSGETMVEVLVAFTLLSIMLVVFSEGIAWATKSEVSASQRRDAADQGMLELQRSLARELARETSEADATYQIPEFSFRIRCKKYTEGNNTYVVYEAIPRAGD